MPRSDNSQTTSCRDTARSLDHILARRSNPGPAAAPFVVRMSRSGVELVVGCEETRVEPGMRLRLLPLRCALLAGGLVTVAQGSPATPFAIGVTKLTIVRQSSTWGPRVLAATVWYPAAPRADLAARPVDDAPHARGRHCPVIVYSHGGCGGAPEAIAPLAEPLAAGGFVFVQFPHPGSTADDCVSNGPSYGRALLERPDDIVYVVNELQRLNENRASPFHATLDTNRVGIIGHSQGGQTALMMPARDPRVKATLSLSPSVAHPDSPPQVWDAIRTLQVPVMVVHGDRDATWTNEGPLKAFAALPADTPRAYLEVRGMGHTPRSAEELALILRYASALFGWYLSGDKSARSILESPTPPNVSYQRVRFP